MSFTECLKNMNWVSIVVIAILSAIIEVAISSRNQEKNKQEFLKELYKIEDIKKDVTFMLEYLVNGKGGKNENTENH